MRKIYFIFMVVIFSAQSLYSQNGFSGFGASLGTNILVGETPVKESILSPNFGLHGIYKFSDVFSLKLQTGYGRFGIDSKNSYISTPFIPIELTGQLSPFEGSTVSPFLQFGLGAFSFSTNGSRYFDGLFISGIGLNAALTDQISLLVSSDLRYTTSDQFNGITEGMYDGYFNFQVGFTYNLDQEKEFKRKPGLERKPIIASTGTRDKVLETIQIQSQIDQLKTKISLRENQISQIVSQIQAREERIKKIQSEVAQLTPKETVEMAETGRPEKISNSEIKLRYRHAQELIRAKRFDVAISELDQLYQNTADHPLRSNFIYWIGECYFAQKKYDKAIEAFSEVGRFKTSYKHDDALIMTGICHLRLGNLKLASQKFKELVDKYPNSEYTAKARKYLQATARQIIS